MYTHPKWRRGDRDVLQGMADVATEILHSVGNALNSVNVSIGCISEQLGDPRVGPPVFNRLAALLDEGGIEFDEI